MESQHFDENAAATAKHFPSTTARDVDINDDNGSEYPDGGGFHAWTVVLGAWCAMLPSMGLLNTLAVLEAHLGTHELRDVPRTQSAWIYSSYAFFLYFCGAQVGPVFDAHDVRIVTVTGSVGIVAALVFPSFSQGMHMRPFSSFSIGFPPLFLFRLSFCLLFSFLLVNQVSC